MRQYNISNFHQVDEIRCTRSSPLLFQVSGGLLHLRQRGPRGGALCQHHEKEADAPQGSGRGGGAAGWAGRGETVYAPSGLCPHLCHSGLPGISPPAHAAALHLRPATRGVHRKRWGEHVWRKRVFVWDRTVLWIIHPSGSAKSPSQVLYNVGWSAKCDIGNERMDVFMSQSGVM